MARRRRSAWPWIIIGLLVLLVVLWVAYWFAAQYAAQKALARLNSGPIGGAQVVCAGPVLGGFPLVLNVRCERVTVSGAGDTMTAALGGVAATAPLYWPGDVAAKLDAPLVINIPGLDVALTTTWSAGNANATAGLAGLKGFGAAFNGFAAQNANPIPHLPVKQAAATEAHGSIMPSTEAGGSYTVRAGATKLNLVRNDGSPLPEMDAETRLTLVDVGPALGNDPAETILAWARKGGTLKIDRVRIAGVGAIITADGTLRLSTEGKLNGGVVLRWNSIAALADFIEALAPGNRERADLPLQGLNAVSVAVDTPDGPLRQTALTFTDGVVWLGIFPLPIDPIPPILF